MTTTKRDKDKITEEIITALGLNYITVDDVHDAIDKTLDACLESMRAETADSLKESLNMNPECINPDNSKLQDRVDELEKQLTWLVRHAIFCAAISRAKGAEILGVPLIDLDIHLAKLSGSSGGGNG